MSELCTDIFRSIYLINVIMGKIGILTRLMVLPALVLAMAACSDEIDLEPQEASVPMIGKSGGTVTGFNGQVVLRIPAGAVSVPTSFLISDLENDHASVKADLELVRAFVIEPFVRFNIPAELTVKCDGCLATGYQLTDDMEVSFYLWDTPKSYYNHSSPCISCCCFDGSLGCIIGCISSTGVISTMAGRKHKILGDYR